MTLLLALILGTATASPTTIGELRTALHEQYGTGQNAQAVEMATAYLEDLDADSDQRAAAIIQLGFAQNRALAFDEAKDSTMLGLRLAEEQGNESLQLEARQNLGIIAGDRGDLQASLQIMLETLAFYEADGPRVANDAADDRLRMLGELGVRRDELERRLADMNSEYREGRRLDVADWRRVCAALPAGSALIEYYAAMAETVTDREYLAFVLRGGECDAPLRVDLGPSETIDEAVVAWRERMGGEAFTTRTDAMGDRLRQLIFDPIKPVLRDTERLFVVADGSLFNVPLSALPDGDRYLVQDWTIGYLDSPHDLFDSTDGRQSAGVLLVGGVEYDGAADGQEPANDGHRGRGLCVEAVDYPDLPGTVAEVEHVARRVPRREPVTLMTGANATERALIGAMPGHRIVHIAAHGFFAGDRCRSALAPNSTAQTRGGFHPMALSAGWRGAGGAFWLRNRPR